MDIDYAKRIRVGGQKARKLVRLATIPVNNQCETTHSYLHEPLPPVHDRPDEEFADIGL